MTTSHATDRLDRVPNLDAVPRLPRDLSPRVPGPPGVATRRAAKSRRQLLGGLFGASPRKQASGGVPRDPVALLVRRITQGFQRSEYLRARALGYQAYLEEQLDHLSIDDSAMDARLANFPTLSMSPKELVQLYPLNTEIPFFELKGAMVVRAVHSKRQLFERMCEFWTDHFNIDHQKDPEWVMKSEDDREVVRRYALSSFPELLVASAHSGAMMYYLDNWLNFAGIPQENYARELLELHTLGVDGGYTETDVKEVAKCLTGWSLNLDPDSPDYLRFQFVKPWHQVGVKTVLGNTIPALSFKAGGNMVLQILASHPSTARHIATKMTNWLLSETPPQALVDEVTATYLATGGDVKAMIRVILREENVVAAGPAPKFKRPFQFAVSLLRGLEAEVYDPLVTVYYLQIMGQSPYDWHPPTGYPDSVEAWGNSLLPRWTFATNLMLNYVPGVQVSLGRLLALLDGFQTKGLAKRIDRRILGDVLAPDEVAGVQQYLDARSPLLWPEVYEAIGLAASAPGYQWA